MGYVNEMGFETTKSFFTGNYGLKLNGKQILKNKYFLLHDNFYSEKTPYVLIEERGDKYFLYNVKENKFIDSKNQQYVIILEEHEGSYFDGYEDQPSGTFYNTPQYLVLNNNNKITFVIPDYTGAKTYTEGEDFKKIMFLPSSQHPFLIYGIDKDNKMQALNNLYSFNSVPIDYILKPENQNAYYLLYLKNNTANKNMTAKNILWVAENYFNKLLEENSTSPKILNDIQEERSNFYPMLVEKLNAEAKYSDNVAHSIEELKKEKEKLAALTELKRLEPNSSKYYNPIRDCEKFINDTEIRLASYANFKKVTQEVNELILKSQTTEENQTTETEKPANNKKEDLLKD